MAFLLFLSKRGKKKMEKMKKFSELVREQFIHADGGAQTSSCRKHIDVLLNSMNERELVVIEATAEGIKKARETEDA